MKKFSKIIYQLFIWISLIIFMYFFIRFLNGVILKLGDILSSANPTVSVAILTTAFTFMANMLVRSYERRLEIEREHRLQKIKIYQKFLPKWLDILSDKRVKTMKTNEDLLIFLKEGLSNLVTYSSGKVIKSFREFRGIALLYKPNNELSEEQSAEEKLKVMLAYENVILAIRKDIGHRDGFSLKEGDLIGLFIKDLENLKKKAQ